MALPLLRRLTLLLACLQLCASCLTAQAVPLTTDGMASPRRPQGVTDAEVLEGAPTTADPVQVRPGGESALQHPGLRGPNVLSGLGPPQEIGSFSLDGSSSSLADVFRPLVNLNPRATATGGNTQGQPGRRNEQDIIMSGTGLNDLVEEAVRGIVSSAIELRVDDQGRASFSLMGMGDFGVMVSGDRNEVALVSGADVLFSANRTPYPQPGGYGGAGHDYAPAGVPAASRPVDTRGESPLHQAMELLSEMATHPLSLLVYAIVGVYALLWNILSAQRSARPQGLASFARSEHSGRIHHESGRRRSRRSRRH